MSDRTDNQLKPEDIYNLSDEELQNLHADQLAAAEGSSDDGQDAASDEVTAGADNPGGEAAADSSDASDDAEDVDSEDAVASPDTSTASESEEEAPADGEDASAAADAASAAERNAEEASSSDEDGDAPDYEAEYKRLMAPFKANGREMKVQNVDEAIRLMQMGANYNKKMAALKPHLKTLKVLEKNGVTSEEELGFLLDLKNKNPQAIKKLLKDSNIDPLDLDAEEGQSYTPTRHSVSDEEMALEEVLDAIQDTEAGSKTLHVVGKVWDEPSKRLIGQHPQLLTVINTHIESGVYEVIADEVARQRALGNLSGLSDLEAYKQVGDSIQARNGFSHLFKEQGQENQPARKQVPPKRSEEDSKLKNKRRAASPSKAAPAQKPNLADFNPLHMSDEEFEKQFGNTLL